MSGDKDGGAGQDALLDPKRRPSQLFSEQRRASYGRGGGDMYANEFEKNVSIDTSKLNEFLFKVGHALADALGPSLHDMTCLCTSCRRI